VRALFDAQVALDRAVLMRGAGFGALVVLAGEETGDGETWEDGAAPGPLGALPTWRRLVRNFRAWERPLLVVRGAGDGAVPRLRRVADHVLAHPPAPAFCSAVLASGSVPEAGAGGA